MAAETEAEIEQQKQAFADLAYTVRHTLKLTQQQMAEKMGVSFATYNRWEQGHCLPNVRTQQRLYELHACRNKDLSRLAFRSAMILKSQCIQHLLRASYKARLRPSHTNHHHSRAR